MAICQWNFKHLEVVGTSYSSPTDWATIRGRIPQLKVETRKPAFHGRKESQTAKPRPVTARSSAKQQSILQVKPPKEKVVTVKVVLPKKKLDVLERNYLCTCDREREISGASKDDSGDVEEVEFNELMKVFLKYFEDPRKESSKTLRNVTKGFQGSRILSSDEAVQVLKLLDTDNYGLKESVLLTIGQLCTSTLNVKKFLEKGMVDQLINLVLLSGGDNIKKEAVMCLSKVVEKTEHADLWLEVMTQSGTEALLGLLTASTPALQQSVLCAIKNLAAHPKMARLLIDHGLESVTKLLSSKENARERSTGNPEIHGLVTQALINIISHDSSTVEMFLSKHDDVIRNVMDLLQYSPCLQQQGSARLLATLAFYKQGLSSLITHNAVGHLLWAVTCSQCSHLREQASIALKNVSANPDKTAAFSALSQVALRKAADSQDETSWDSDSLGIFSASEKNLKGQPSSNISGISSEGAVMDREAGSKTQRTISELTSLLTLVFQSDALWRTGAERQFLKPSSVGDLRSTRLKKPNNFHGKEMYLRSLRVLTNCLVIMSNLLLISETSENTSRDEFEGRRLNQVALIIQNGGLKFIHDLNFLSEKLLKANPPLFHNIDPTTLPPKEITTTLKNARTDLIFESASKRKESCKCYPEFGFEENEIDFVKAAVHVLCLLAKATAPEFDPCMEDMEVLERSKPKTGKRQISFQKSAVLVRNVMRITTGAGGRKMIQRSSSARSLTRKLSQAGLTSTKSAKSLHPSSCNADQSTSSLSSTGAQDLRETTHYVKQSLLDAKVICCLAPWIMCGIYDIQANVLKVIRYLQHSKYASSGAGPLSQPAPKEAWTSKVPPSLASRSSTLSQRSSHAATPVRNGMNKSKYLGFTCVRHVIQHCGGYLLDSLAPPVPPILGKTTLMVLREAVVNGEADTRLKIVKLGCFAQVIEYIRGNEDDETLQALGIVVIRMLVGNDVSLKQLFLAHGGMNLIMALHQYKEGIVKEQAAHTMFTFRRGGENSRVHRRSRTADGRLTKRRQKLTDCADIWEEVGEKWKGQDQVLKVLKKFNVRY